jgi:hypothetical protein
MDTTVTAIGDVVVAALEGAGYSRSTIGQYRKSIRWLGVSSRIRAPRTCWAGWEPARVIRVSSSRSAGFSATGRDFVLDSTASLPAAGREGARQDHHPQPCTLATTLY